MRSRDETAVAVASLYAWTDMLVVNSRHVTTRHRLAIADTKGIAVIQRGVFVDASRLAEDDPTRVSGADGVDDFGTLRPQS